MFCNLLFCWRTPESQKQLQRGSIAAWIFWQFGWFCGNVHLNSRCFVAKFLPSLTLFFGGKYHKMCAVLSQNFHKNVCRFIGKFPHNFRCWKSKKKNNCFKISTKTCFLGKFPQKICLVGKFPQQIRFVGGFLQKFALLTNYH